MRRDICEKCVPVNNVVRFLYKKNCGDGYRTTHDDDNHRRLPDDLYALSTRSKCEQVRFCMMRLQLIYISSTCSSDSSSVAQIVEDEV